MDVKAYQAMERFVREGKIRSIGLSNWCAKDLTGSCLSLTKKMHHQSHCAATVPGFLERLSQKRQSDFLDLIIA